MPCATPDEQRAYQREWVARRRAEWIAANGPCATCGSAHNLEVDHVDPATKRYEPSSIWSLTEEKRLAELAKCQVLCEDCHRKKTTSEVPPTAHGRGHMYQTYGCRCELCRAWKRESDAKYRDPNWRVSRGMETMAVLAQRQRQRV